MIVTKLKALLAVAAVALAVFTVAQADDAKPKPAPARQAAAENEPKLWLLYPDSQCLVALLADGTVARTVSAPDAAAILHVSPRQNKIWLHGKDGQGARTAVNVGGLPENTLHVRAVEPGGVKSDLGVELPAGAYCSTDGVTLLTSRVRRAARNNEFEHTLIDVATKKMTKLEHLPKSHHIQGVFAEGKSLLTMEYGDGKKMPRLYQVAVAGGPPRLITDKLSPPGPSGLSPDGARVLVTTKDSREKFEAGDYSENVYVLDLATGKATKIGDETRLIHAQGRWSADGKRVAYTWCEWAKDARGLVSTDGVPPTRLVVRDADGKNPKTLVTSDEAFRVVAWE